MPVMNMGSWISPESGPSQYSLQRVAELRALQNAIDQRQAEIDKKTKGNWNPLNYQPTGYDEQLQDKAREQAGQLATAARRGNPLQWEQTINSEPSKVIP